MPKIEFSWWCGTLSCTTTCTEIVFNIPTFHFQITITMETIVLTKSQLCNIISLSTMCATTKFNGTIGELLNYIAKDLHKNGVGHNVLDDVAEHLRDCVLDAQNSLD